MDHLKFNNYLTLRYSVHQCVVFFQLKKTTVAKQNYQMYLLTKEKSLRKNVFLFSLSQKPIKNHWDQFGKSTFKAEF